MFSKDKSQDKPETAAKADGAEEKVKVTFLEDRTVQDELAETSKATTFKRGKTYTLPQSSADRWVRRDAAVYGTKLPDTEDKK